MNARYGVTGNAFPGYDNRALRGRVSLTTMKQCENKVAAHFRLGTDLERGATRVLNRLPAADSMLEGAVAGVGLVTARFTPGGCGTARARRHKPDPCPIR